ncbi:MAG: hypothetical protein EON59_10980 [Alphaproteobacteria bacterium]|nr:MAG: hypothetical protein EON59_10980 [Alphaproteobacteria bacterium]
MNVFTFPLRYLWLIDEGHRPLFLRNSLEGLALAVLLSVPFWFSDANYFGESGLLHRFGAFSGVLTGFYVAALVAIASFASTSATLDDPIELGPILERNAAGVEPDPLTRRQYVCAMFGYLSFISLALSLIAILAVSVSTDIAPMLTAWLGAELIKWIGWVALFLVNVVIAHMVVTTCHGLYYLIDRMYAQKAILLDKDGNPVER